MRNLASFLPLLFCLFGHAMQARELPKPLSPYVSDYANILSAAEEASLNQELRDLRTKNNIQMAVVLMNARADYGSTETLEGFSTRLFNTWGIGDKDSNNGILFVVLAKDRLTRIELGTAYGDAWDGTAARVLDRHVLPAFKNADYDKGIAAGTREIIATIAQPFAEGSPAPRGKGLSGWIVAGLAVLAGLFAFRRKIKDRAQEFRRCPNCGRRMLHVTRETTRAATGKTAGQALRRITCDNCAYDNSEVYPISPTRSPSTDGSFGGGRSGGGGASGNW